MAKPPVPSGNTITVLSSHTLPATCGIFPPPNGRQLLTTSLDSSLILWEVSSSTPIFKSSMFCPPNSPEVDPAEHGITALAVSPNGQIAAVGGAAGGVRIVGLEKGNILATLKGHAEGESIEALTFIDVLGGAAGGKGVVLVSGGTDGKGFVWDVNTGRVRAELQHDVSQAVDPRHRASSLELTWQEPITSLAPHPAPNYHLLTSASADGTLKTWDVRTGALISTHKGHMGVVNGVAVASAPEGTDAKEVVVSAGDEGVSLIWKV
jgi:ribosome assembly protein SQT1